MGGWMEEGKVVGWWGGGGGGGGGGCGILNLLLHDILSYWFCMLCFDVCLTIDGSGTKP